MKRYGLRIFTLMMSIAALCMMQVPALAAAPVTGDQRGQNMGVMIGLLIASLVVIVIVLAVGGKKKNKKNKK